VTFLVVVHVLWSRRVPLRPRAGRRGYRIALRKVVDHFGSDRFYRLEELNTQHLAPVIAFERYTRPVSYLNVQYHPVFTFSNTQASPTPPIMHLMYTLNEQGNR
jgi:hypothetical protein